MTKSGKLKIKESTRNTFQLLAVIGGLITVITIGLDLFTNIDNILLTIGKFIILIYGLGTFFTDSWFLIKS